MNLKKNAGYEAANEITDGQIVGLGTGSTTYYFIEKLGMRIKKEEMEIMGIPTSYQSRLLAKKFNIPLTSLDEFDIDVAVDGADEVDLNKNLIKGGGAAHTLEKIIDYSAEKFIVVVDESKLVNQLGNFPVPLEIIPSSYRLIKNILLNMGSKPEIRMGKRKDGPVITDHGNFIIDAEFNVIDEPNLLETELNSIPGVVENGIFTNAVDAVFVGTSKGIKKI